MSVIISVIIPTFNRQELTERAIASVRSQSPDSVEIVIVDDAGTVPFQLDHPSNSSGISVRVVRLTVNCGPGLARSAGAQAALGKLIAFLDSDDEFAGSWIDGMLGIIAREPTTSISKTMIVGIVENPQRVAGLVARALRALPVPLRLSTARLVSVFFNVFYTPSIAITRDSVLFHEQLRHCEDYFMTTVSLFQVDRLLLFDGLACRLGRAPNTPGGETALSNLMHEGEIAARRAIARHPSVPTWYKALYPLGRAYQAARTAMKTAFR